MCQLKVFALDGKIYTASGKSVSRSFCVLGR